MKFSPHEYQARAIVHGVENSRSAMFLDPGMGKTSITLAIYRASKRLGLVDRALVVAPLRVIYSVWPSERDKWSPFRSISMSIVHGDENKRLDAMEADADIYLTNPASVEWLQKIDSGERRRELKREVKRLRESVGGLGDDDIEPTLKKWRETERAGDNPFAKKVVKTLVKLRSAIKLRDRVIEARLPDGLDFLIVDESTKFKRQTSTRFRSLKRLLKHFARRIILTGTPTPRAIDDIWSQIFLLDEGERLFATEGEFRVRYGSKGGFKNREWFVYPGAEALIEDKIRDIVLRLDADDWLTMPDLITNDILVDLPPKAAAIYRSMEDELFAELDAGAKVFATSGSSKYNACRQIANGGVYAGELYGTEDKTVEHIHEAKIDAIESLVDELSGRPLLVFYLYRHDLDRLRLRFGKNLPAIGTGTDNRSPTPKEINRLIGAWNAGDLPILPAQPAAMSHGLNMQAGGNHMATIGVPDDFEFYDQMIRRIYRQGVEGTVFVHRIFSRSTVDFLAAARIDRKEVSQTRFLNSLNEYRKAKNEN